MFKREKVSTERMERNRVRNAIETMAETYLTEYDAVLTFEVLPNCIDNVLIVIGEESLQSRYDIAQMSESLFQMRLKDLGGLEEEF